MGKIIVSDNMSLDGVIQDPAGDEGFDRGGWVGLIKDHPDLAQLALEEALDSDALLVGRRTYEWFVSRWPSRTGELADRLNGMPKFVVSSTLHRATWTNTTVLTGDVVDAVRRLKREVEGDIVVTASSRLVRRLLERDLVDEIRLKVFPVVLGAGDRLFGPIRHRQALRLLDLRTLDGDITYLTYERRNRSSPEVDLASGVREVASNEAEPSPRPV